MSPSTHRALTITFLLTNALVWLPWGFISLLWPEAWSGQLIPNLEVFNLANAVTRTEVRAMYGGLQMAVGAYAIFGVLHAKYREPALVLFVFALTGLALCRLGSMAVEGEPQYFSFRMAIPPGLYNQVGLSLYELPNMIFAWALVLLRPRAEASTLGAEWSARRPTVS